MMTKSTMMMTMTMEIMNLTMKSRYICTTKTVEYGNHEFDYEVKIYLCYKKQLNTEGLQERAEKKLRILQINF